MMRRLAIATALISSAVSLTARGQNVIAITGGRLLTVTRGVIDSGTVVVENGKIAAVGRDVQAAAGAQVIDARGKVVMPGMIDAGDQLGLVEIPAEQITVDATEYTDPVHPELRVLDALNPRSELFRVTRAEGITNALSVPAPGNLIAGQSALIQLDGDTVDRIVVKSPVALHINLGESSRSIYGEKGKPPGTRMGQMAVVRQEFLREPARMETLDARLDNAAQLYKAGVPIAIRTSAANEARDLPFEVGYAIASGLPEQAALEAVTINPARFFGVDDRLGSLEQGKQASLIVLDGMPFRTKTHVVTELIGGKVVDLSNHQTELYEFYKRRYGIE